MTEFVGKPDWRHLLRKPKIWLVLAVGLLLSVSGWFIFSDNGGQEKKPLYWVAPMDSNYRRDGPGLSPMGMDLVPVYAEDSTGVDGVGVVSISPEIQNQLGVRTIRAELGILNYTLRSYGRIIFDPTLIAKLSPRVSGWVDMLFVSTEGESVRRGQPLYSIYSPELIKAQEHYLSAIKRGVRNQILETEDDLRALKVDEIAIARLKDERVVQQSVVFHAPKDGVLGMLKVGEDQYVEPGDLLMSIGTLDNVWVELDVFESQASLIKPQQYISFTTPSQPGLVWEGEVDYIYPVLDSIKQSLRFRAKIENRRMLLKPNMHVQALISLTEREPTILLPRQAIISLGQQDRVVLNLGQGRFKSVAVVLGESSGDQVEILEGIEPGDSVVASAHFLIDSESSKTSDFKRMLALEEGESAEYPPTWVDATVVEIDLVERKLRLQHGYIDDWEMPSMTMNFKVVDGINIQDLNVGDELRVHLADGDPLFRVTEIQRLSKESAQ